MDLASIDTAVLRRILFAVVYLPKDCPNYWEVVSKFSATSDLIDSQQVRVLVENMQLLNERVFATDRELALELQSMNFANCEPLGIVLISPNKVCSACSGKLLIRSDRPSQVTVYTECDGTVIGSHFQKFCQNYRKGCIHLEINLYLTMIQTGK